MSKKCLSDGNNILDSRRVPKERCDCVNRAETPHQDTSPQRPEKTITKWVVSIATFMWILVILGGFGIGKLYIDRSLEAVQQANAIHVQTLKDQLDSMAVDIDQIQVALNNADQTLSSSGSTQENLNKKIQDLDNQLQLLAKSLAILKEAP